LPLTVAVPTVVPPLVQLVGAVACGPNTTNVIVPVGADPPVSLELIWLAAIAVPAVPVFGAVTLDTVVVVLTTVDVMLVLSQVLAAALLLLLPP
jgi:hypothetical protein